MSRRAVGGAMVVTVGAAALLISRRVRTKDEREGRAATPRSRWRAATIECPPDDVMPGGRVPRALAELDDLVEVDVRPAPGDKGSELRARPRSAPSDRSDADVVRAIRAALRQTKQLIEVGEVLRVDPVPHGKRTPTPTGTIVELATRRADKEGLL